MANWLQLGFILSIKTEFIVQHNRQIWMLPSLQATFDFKDIQYFKNTDIVSPFETAGNVILLYFCQFCFLIQANQQIGLVSYDCVYFLFVFFVLFRLGNNRDSLLYKLLLIYSCRYRVKATVSF